MAYFPMYVDISGRRCLVVGGGEVAERKILTLLDFEALVVVVAPEINKSVLQLAEEFKTVTIKKKLFSEEDCNDMILVVAATDSKEINHKIADICKEKSIPVNAVDQKEDCTFIFPSYIKEKNVVAAVSSGGNSPLITQKIRDEISKILTPDMGELSETLGKYREEIRLRIPDMELRKKAYQEIYDEAVTKNKITTERIETIIANFSRK